MPLKLGKESLPYMGLGLSLVAAATILLGGEYLARHEAVEHIAGDRGPLTIVSDGMEQEIMKLERLYENHLRQTALETSRLAGSAQSVWEACKDTVGVNHWALLHADENTVSDLQTVIDLEASSRFPEPAFHPDSGGLPHNQTLLSSEDLLHQKENWGWVDEPGKPLFFWQKLDAGDSSIVMTIDPQRLCQALEPWFAQWAETAFTPLRVANQTVALIGPDGADVAGNGKKPDTQPDLVLPIRSRFGTWQFAVWDRLVKHITYDFGTQMATGALAVLIALIGIIGFVQQRRALVLAEQRVSFVNRLSHELRTPLTNILLNLDLAGDALDESSHEPQRRFSLVQEEARRLGRLIENTLAFSQGQRGLLRSETRPCSPSVVIQSVIEQFSPSFVRRGLSVNCTGSITGTRLMDVDAFTLILSNLLSNVEKYVPGGELKISFHDDNGVLVVSVTDDGPGIPRDKMDRIFQPFERLDGRINEGASGTGLGLAIAREQANAAGGSLFLIPSAHGACFEIRLPIAHSTSLSIVKTA